MKINLLLTLLLVGGRCMSQCPDITVDLTGGHCVGDTLTVDASGHMNQIGWYNGSQLVKTVTSSITTSPATIVAGGNGPGSAANQLYLPAQIYVDGNDNLFVADESNSRILKFPPGSSSATNGVNAIQIGQSTATSNSTPFTGLYLDDQGNIYTEGDTQNPPGIQKWAPGASSGMTVATLTHTGTNMSGWNESQIFVDAANNVYVPEPGNNRIQKWTPGATAGVTVAGGNGAGASANQLNWPTGVYVDKAGNIYVADSYNSRIQKWAPGASAGITVAGGNGSGAALNQLDYPINLCVDGAGNMYIADCYNNRVLAWAPGAAEGVTVAGGNGSGSALNQLYSPTDVFLDNKGYLYICDEYNCRIMKCLPSLVYAIDTTLVTNAAGTYTAAVISEGGCALTTNAIVVLPVIHPDMSISASPNPVCSGDSILFAAHAVTNTGLTYVYQWLVNGGAAGVDSAGYIDRQPSNGDVIVCSAADEQACATAVSNSITLTVNPSPQVQSGQVYSLSYGGSVALTPVITGDATGYSWSPATGLSDTTVADPIADPSLTTQYTLKVVTPEGCSASGTILVNVFGPLRIPNAFTPNGDGKNDVFYVLAGPPGAVIKEFAVYNRWGQRIFQVQDAPAGDPSFGWNGQQHGSPVPTGTYVYILSIQMPDGKQQAFSGTVELIR